MNIGRTIKLMRVAAGVNQLELAKRLDISPSLLSLIESGKRDPGLTLLRKISREIDMPLSVLLFDPEDYSDDDNPQRKLEYARIRALMMSEFESRLSGTRKQVDDEQTTK